MLYIVAARPFTNPNLDDHHPTEYDVKSIEAILSEGAEESHQYDFLANSLYNIQLRAIL